VVASESSHTPQTEPTVYDVLAARARTHGKLFLAAQALVAAALASVLLAARLPWWPLAMLLVAISAYSAWGLVDARQREGGTARWILFLKLTLAIIATLGAIAAIGGTALAAFTGDRPGPYGACTDAAGHTFACDKHGGRADPRGPR
jgi:hypothetical protein